MSQGNHHVCLVSLEITMPFVLFTTLEFLLMLWAKLKEIDRPHLVSRETSPSIYLEEGKGARRHDSETYPDSGFS